MPGNLGSISQHGGGEVGVRGNLQRTPRVKTVLV